MKSILPALLLLSPLPAALQVVPGDPQPHFIPPAPYLDLTDDLDEVANFHPEPFAGIALDASGAIYAVNPYASTWVKYASPTATAPAVRASTGHNPVSIGIWDAPTGPDQVVVVCTGSHAAFLHSPSDGRVLGVVQLDSEPADLVIDQENDWAFVSCRGDNTVVRIDLDTFTVDARYAIGCGVRPGPLWLDTGSPEVAGDTRVYVAPMITGNNSTFEAVPGGVIGKVRDLDLEAVELPDQDVFRIDPFQSPATAVVPVLREVGSLIFELGRNPSDGVFWALSTDSNNKDPVLDTEFEVKGQVVINQLVRASGVNATSTLFDAPPGLDLDDYLPAQGSQYSPAESLNQARALVFQADGEAFVAGPLSDVLAELTTGGTRQMRYNLPAGAQCYALATRGTGTILALCLGTMTIEVFTEGNPAPGTPLPLGVDPTPPHVRAGRDVFLDGSRSQDGRASCLGCHEGMRTDVLGWSISGHPNDAKDVMLTQSLLGIADTFPHHWRGERDMLDFQKAWVGLLGADEADAPDAEEMQDVVAYIHSLRAPANPKQSYRREVDDQQSPGFAPNGMTGSAVQGQQAFLSEENFNNNTCAQCHPFTTGSNANMFFEVASFHPRAQEVEVAHLRQLQHRSLLTATLTGGQLVNQNGWGAPHNGQLDSIFDFIFTTFTQLSPGERVDIFKFVEQFDQGIAAGAHWAAWLDQATSASVVTDIQEILIDSAEAGWLDVVAWGEFEVSGVARRSRWLYDPAVDLFHNDSQLIPDKSFAALVTAAAADDARLAFVGAPPGNGFRLAFDMDFDDLDTENEARIGTDPWNPDTDGDGWPDGYEVAHDKNPKVPQAASGDTVLPGVASSSIEFVTARSAKFQVRFTEDVRFVVTYALQAGGPTHTFEQEDFVRADTFVLTHSNPSRPLLTSLNDPDPDTTPGAVVVFDATISLFDRSGNPSGSLSLPSFTPLAAQFQLGPSFMHVGDMGVVASPTGVPGELQATVTLEPDLHYLETSSTEYVDANGAVVVCTISVQDPVTKEWVQSDDFTSTAKVAAGTRVWLQGSGTPTPPPLLWEAIPQPYVLTAPAASGSTQFTFVQGGLVPGQKVKIVVQGLLIPTGQPLTFVDSSVFVLQPLQTEEFHEIDVTF